MLWAYIRFPIPIYGSLVVIGIAFVTTSLPLGVRLMSGVLVQVNRMEKGPHTGNWSAAISIGEEGVDRPTPQILVEGNSFRNDSGHETTFVVNLTATPATLRGNHFTGAVKPLRGDGAVSG